MILVVAILFKRGEKEGISMYSIEAFTLTRPCVDMSVPLNSKQLINETLMSLPLIVYRWNGE